LKKRNKPCYRTTESSACNSLRLPSKVKLCGSRKTVVLLDGERSHGKQEVLKVEDFINKIKKEIEEKK